ncbi:MAG TPA: hypothetical protein VLF95_11800 [Vicinamibacteria bacterium]|nr:hypothetical protein [Vicinamibacteria bacterium]
MAIVAKHHGRLVAVASAALVAWAAVGFYQGLNSGFSGGLYDPGYVVPGVWPGGLADRSGFRAGDRVISVEGTPVEELGMESRWPRRLAPRIGQSHRFVVDRDGERVPIDVLYPPPSRAAVSNRVGALLVGLAFLGFGLWAFFGVGSPSARTLASVGLAAGAAMAFGLGPNLGSWNGVQGHVATACSVLTWILILRFFLIYPTAKRASRSRLASWIVYGAWAGLLIFLVAELVVHPALYYATGSVSGPLVLAYGVLILAAIIHTLAKTPREELRRSGMPLILGGLAVAAVATAASFAGLRLPGWISALSIGMIPLTMALAVRQREGRHDDGMVP